MSQTSVVKRISYLLYGVILIVAISAVSWQIYRISVGKVPDAIPIESLPAKDRVPDKAFEKVNKISDSPEVKKILALQPVNIEELGGKEDRVVFRSAGGELLCTISKKLEKDSPKLLPLTVDKEGKTASGAGVICGSVHSQWALNKMLGSCDGKPAAPFGIGMWDKQISAGFCVGGFSPLARDAQQNQVDNNTGERMKYQVLGFDQYTKLGDYACGMSSKGVACVRLSDGKGFSFSDSFGTKVFE